MEQLALRRFLLPNCEPSKTCFFAGQKLTAHNTERARTQLPHEIAQLIAKGVDTFISGGSAGFELDAAEAVLTLQKSHPSLRLFFVLPYPDHTQRWKDPNEVKRLRNLLSRTDAYMNASEKPAGRRSYHTICLAYYAAYGLCALQNERQSAAAQTVYYAVRNGTIVKNLVENSMLLESFIERAKAFRYVTNNRQKRL